MNTFSKVAVVVAAFAQLVICAAHAQQPVRQPAPPSRTGSPSQLAVIDVAHVLKNYHRFQQRLEAIKVEVKEYDADLGKRRQALARRGEGLKALKPTSREYKTLETELAREMSSLQVDAQLKKKEILDKEARNYFDAYQDILGAVAAVANQYGIGLVLRFNREEMDPDDRGSVLQGVNRAVVYQRKLDITELVLNRLHASQARVPRQER